MSKIKKALDKAKEARNGAVIKPEDEIPVGESSARVTQEEVQEKQFDFRKPIYDRTKVQPIDFDRLEGKRIISACQGNMIADRVKIIRTQIINTLKENGGNTILIASANPGEGRTTIAANLAMTLSQQTDSTVLLVDSDLRKPSLHTLFELDARQGLSDYLKNKAAIEDILINPGIPRLIILPGGRPSINSSELLSTPRMQLLIKEMKERYPDRFIIFDSSPILTSADPLVLARYIDGIIIVVEAEKTKKNDMIRMTELLKDRPIIGTIFNKVRE
jgi:protein-tyrosine kinase